MPARSLAAAPKRSHEDTCKQQMQDLATQALRSVAEANKRSRQSLEQKERKMYQDLSAKATAVGAELTKTGEIIGELKKAAKGLTKTEKADVHDLAEQYQAQARRLTDAVLVQLNAAERRGAGAGGTRGAAATGGADDSDIESDAEGQ